MKKDPVCGRELGEGGDVQRFDYMGRTYFFCSLRCRTRFIDEPITYVADEVALKTTPQNARS